MDPEYKNFYVYPQNTFNYECPSTNVNIQEPLSYNGSYNGLNIDNEIVKASLSGKLDLTNSSTLVSQTMSDARYWGNDGPVVVDRLMQGVGEQDILAHLNVSRNRYTAEKSGGEIYIQPMNPHLSPYTKSLYQTPYDTTQNLISTGILHNSYTGEAYETFENQLPPPNTTKGQLCEFQLQHINPRLLHLSGGYNHHNPPPRKIELNSETFNPVDIKGGSNPWGSQLYSAQVRDDIETRVSRDIYNNRNGDYAVEPSMNGDKPQGYIGFVPRNQFRPYLPPTQELNLQGRMQIPENINPDLRKREEYTGEVYSRKAHVLVTDRAMMPNQLINGVQAIAQIPIATELHDTQRTTVVQGYITPAFLDGATRLHTTFLDDRVGRVNAERMNPVAPIDCTNDQPTVIAIDRDVQGRIATGETFRLAGNPHSEKNGSLITDHSTVLPTMDVYTHPILLPTSVTNQSNIITNLHNVRDTLKGTILSENRSSNFTPPVSQDSSFVIQNVNRDTLKGTIQLPIIGVTPVARGDIIVNQESIRETLKSLNDLHRINSVQQTNTLGRLIVSTSNAKDTLTGHGQSLPTGAVTEIPQGYVHLDKSVLDTQRRTMPSWNHTQAVNGQTLGDHLGPGLFVVQEVRGVDEQNYVTQNKKVLDGIGGSSTRVIGDYAPRMRDDRVTMNYSNSDVVNQPRIDRFIPPTRPTLRAYNEMDEDRENKEKLDM